MNVAFRLIHASLWPARFSKTSNQNSGSSWMSATLDPEPVAQFLDAETLRVEGELILSTSSTHHRRMNVNSSPTQPKPSRRSCGARTRATCWCFAPGSPRSKNCIDAYGMPPVRRSRCSNYMAVSPPTSRNAPSSRRTKPKSFSPQISRRHRSRWMASQRSLTLVSPGFPDLRRAPSLNA